MADEKDYLFFTGVVEGIGSKREAGKGPRKVEMKAKPDDQFNKTFRCWENAYDEDKEGPGDEKSEDFAALEEFYESGDRVTVKFYERHYQSGGKDRSQNVIVGVEAAAEDTPAGLSGEAPETSSEPAEGGSKASKKAEEKPDNQSVVTPGSMDKLAEKMAKIIIDNMKAAGLIMVSASQLNKAPAPEQDPAVREAMLEDFLKQAEEKAGLTEKAIQIRYTKLFGEGEWRQGSDEQLTALATAAEFEWD